VNFLTIEGNATQRRSPRIADFLKDHNAYEALIVLIVVNIPLVIPAIAQQKKRRM
jgi:hypothetical protein